MKKILLADDSITIQKVVELTFSEGDYQVVCVSNGTQALKKTQELQPDIILLDVIMPEKNGYEVCEQIKRNPATSGIPVLLLTGTFEPFDKKRAEAIRADGHLTKPFESQSLVSKVEALIAARPSVVPVERAGAMDIIAGGEVRHLAADPVAAPPRHDPPRQAPPHQPMPPPSAYGREPFASSAPAPAAPAPWGPPASDPDEAAWDGTGTEGLHPALAPPDPVAGGSYIGFADLATSGEEAEEGVVPDRFDSVPAQPASTLRISREAMLAAARESEEPEGTPPSGEPEESSYAPPMEGFTAGYEMPEAGQRGAASGSPMPPFAPASPVLPMSGTAGEEPSWEHPAPEFTVAPPEADTGSFESVHEGPPHGQAAAELSPEAMDQIAEEVVRRISDRVVREIAWEIIPQVAEILVSRRIKELEEGDGG